MWGKAQLDISGNLVQKNQDDFTNLNTEKSGLKAEIRFRCPGCQKLYSTTPDAFEDAEAGAAKATVSHLPEFDCQNCYKPFILTQDKNEFGLYETKANNHVFSECPKCTKLMPLNYEECPSCGVFIEKYQQVAQSENPMLFELNRLWKNVLENFNHDSRHQEFLNLCQKNMALNLAFQKYDELRKTMNYDTTCEKYLKQIEIRLEHQFAQQRAIDDNVKAAPKRKFTQRLSAWVSLVGFALLIFNKVRPTFPNVNGVVVSITVMAFGLWLVSSQNRDNIKL